MKDAQIKRMIEAGFTHLYGGKFTERRITHNGRMRFRFAAENILGGMPFQEFYNRFFGYPVSRPLTERSEEYRELYAVMARA
jgi:hypothetical protein